MPDGEVMGSMSIRFRPSMPLAVSAVVLVMLMILPLSSLAATLSVPGDYPTIGAAIANASAGDTIVVGSGTYHENVNVDKGLTLNGNDTGHGMPVIDSGSGIGVDVWAGDVLLKGFVITGSSTGISLHGYGNDRVIDNAVMNNDYGIMLTGTHGANVMNNTVSGNHNVGIYVGDSNGNVFYLNKIANNQYGISITGLSSGNAVYMNAIQDNTGSNGLANGLSNQWNSSIPITYGYGGRQFSNSLGNYWGSNTGSDANGDGIMDSPMVIANNNEDYNPLAEAILDRPAADYTANATTGVAPMGVQFTDKSKGYAVSWHWDFGDGTASDQQDPIHVYGTPGRYAVSLTVTNAHGQDKVIRGEYINVALTPGPYSDTTVTPSPSYFGPTISPPENPTITPIAATPTPTAKPAKPSPGMSIALGLIAIAAALLFVSKKDR